MSRRNVVGLCAAVLIAALGAYQATTAEVPAPKPTPATEPADQAKAASEAKPAPFKPADMASFVRKGVAWLIAAQHADGGWGGGSHAHQDVRDPHGVVTDPATTAFTLLALLRAGHTPVAGDHQAQVRRGLEYLVAAVEKAPDEGPRITELTGTQPQSKLGQYVDTSLTAQYLARARGLMPKTDALYERVDAALDKCLAKLQASQQADGGWGEGGGWAPVLQSSLGCSALEIASASGKNIDRDKLARAREYQKNQVDASGRQVTVRTVAAAGVQLYAFGGAIRGNASDAAEASRLIEEAKQKGDLPASASVSGENLQKLGLAQRRASRLAAAADQHAKQIERLDDENLLAGFGNNGGEEYLSYLLTSESLVIAGRDKFNQWNDKMHARLQKIQNADGSWTGHHCITSPVFCTAAVVQCLTADRDAEFLLAMAERTSNRTAKSASITNP